MTTVIGPCPVDAQVTVVLTTSPTPSAPGTELISEVLDSFSQHCPDFLGCSIIVVLDAYDHIASAARLKKGYVTEQQAIAYDAYKDNVKRLVLETHGFDVAHSDFQHSHDEAEYGNPMIPSNKIGCTIQNTKDGRVTFIEPDERLGFGLAVRSALRLVKTPYVWIQQHDWVLNDALPLRSMLDIMIASEDDTAVPVKYICLSAPRSQAYAVSDKVIKFPELGALTKSLKRDFVSASKPDIVVPLTPMFFWHDKPHLASTRHYLERVFPSRLAIPKGAFIEDTIGHRARTQMKQGSWHRWATWLYYPNNGRTLGLRHLDGRTWRGTENEARKKQAWIEQNAGKPRKKTKKTRNKDTTAGQTTTEYALPD